MITVTVEKKYGATTIHAKISAHTIERAVELAGPNAHVEFPINGEAFFASIRAEGIDYSSMSPEQLEVAYEADLPGAHEAYLNVLKDDLGEEAFEVYAIENCLV